MANALTILTPDEWLLLYIAAFGMLCAALIGRESRLGWALFTKNLTYALVFAYAVIRRIFPQYDSAAVMIGARVLLALSLTWAIYELVNARYIIWRRHGLDSRLLVGRRERVVSRREGVATRREDVVTQREDAMDLPFNQGVQ